MLLSRPSSFAPRSVNQTLPAAAAVTLAFVAWYVNLPEPGKLAAVDGTVELAPGEALTGAVPAIEPEEVNADAGDAGDAVQLASIDALSDASGLPEVESELRRLQSLREFMQ